jgi:hypothetical protein
MGGAPIFLLLIYALFNYAVDISGCTSPIGWMINEQWIVKEYLIFISYLFVEWDFTEDCVFYRRGCCALRSFYKYFYNIVF